MNFNGRGGHGETSNTSSQAVHLRWVPFALKRWGGLNSAPFLLATIHNEKMMAAAISIVHAACSGLAELLCTLKRNAVLLVLPLRCAATKDEESMTLLVIRRLSDSLRQFIADIQARSLTH
jgi:hypothetical protein